VIGIDAGFGEPDDWDGPGSAPGDLDEDGPLLSRPLPRLVLEFQTNAIRTRWRMRRAVALVGSAPGCAVRLNGPSVARYHCALVLTGQGLWVVDLLGPVEPPGTPGIVVNGDRVRFARIDPGDVLRVGIFSVGVRYLPAAPRKAPPAARERVVADASASGEIELVGKGHAEPPCARASDSEVEALRREYEDQIAELAVLHREEVEGLRNEIDELNDLIEQLRASAPAKRRHGRRRGQSEAASPAPRDWPRKVSVRTLGTARRRAGLPPPIPAGHPLDAAMPGPDLAAVDPVAGVAC
jgi:pSer/pThr/pTyr-binding forkhead associated (FHA) protein